MKYYEGFMSISSVMCSYAPSIQEDVLQCRCVSGGHAAGRECEVCRRKREAISQRAATNQEQVRSIPQIVYELTRWSGQSLNTAAPARLAPGSGNDFSQCEYTLMRRPPESVQPYTPQHST
jgi:hypothetical protein